MSNTLITFIATLAIGQVGPSATPAAPKIPGPVGNQPSIRTRLVMDKPVILEGRALWGEFTITNLTPAPVELTAPGADAAATDTPGMGLPLGHVFSGENSTALSIEDSHGLIFGDSVTLTPPEGVPPLTLAPHGSVGVRLELTQYYDALSRSGTYQLRWRPYGGTVSSEKTSVTILPEQQAMMVTDLGKLTIRFYYDEAPRHVQNFLELVRKGFYDNLTFHKLIPGGIVQGGDPLGTGHGIRKDGKRLKAEFSHIPFRRGTIGMARLERDPDSASCQFYICLGRQPSLDGRQTAFAYLVGEESFETLKQIESIPTGPGNRPVRDIYIRAISLENVPARERVSKQSASSEDSPETASRTITGPDGQRLLPPTAVRSRLLSPRAMTRPAEEARQ